MIAARQIAFGRGAKRKPYDCEVEYLEANKGNCYLVIPIQFREAHRITAKFTECNVSSSRPWVGGLFGVCGHTNARSVGAKIYPDTSTLSFLSDGNIVATWGISSVVDIDVNNSNSTVTVNGETQDVLFSTSGESNPIGIFAFVRYANGDIQPNEATNNGRVHYFRVYDSVGSMLFDLIPVRVGNVGYMYDKVSGQLFGNSGTGAFILGVDAVSVNGGVGINADV